MENIPYDFDIDNIHDIEKSIGFLKQVDGCLKGFVDHLSEVANHIHTKESFYLNQISTLSEQLATAQGEISSANDQI